MVPVKKKINSLLDVIAFVVDHYQWICNFFLFVRRMLLLYLITKNNRATHEGWRFGTPRAELRSVRHSSHFPVKQKVTHRLGAVLHVQCYC